MNALDHLERLLSITEQFKPQLTGKDLDWWQDASAFAADEREQQPNACNWCGTTDTMGPGDYLCEACDEAAEDPACPECENCGKPIKGMGMGEAMLWIDITGGDVCGVNGDNAPHYPHDPSAMPQYSE